MDTQLWRAMHKKWRESQEIKDEWDEHGQSRYTLILAAGVRCEEPATDDDYYADGEQVIWPHGLDEWYRVVPPDTEGAVPMLLLKDDGDQGKVWSFPASVKDIESEYRYFYVEDVPDPMPMT